MKPTSRIYALALAVFVLLAGYATESWAQQGQTDRYGSRKPACGCYVCGTPLTVSFEDKDCAGILAEDACGERLAKLPKEERERFCQKIKAQRKFTSFKDSCPAFARYCSPETTAAQDRATPEPGTAGATGSEPSTKPAAPAEPPPTAAQELPASTTQAAALPLASLRVNPTGVTGGTRVQGTVELVQAPGPDGLTVTLESSDPQLASLPPSVTITHGTASAETGPLSVKATFPIDTRPVNESTTVVIKARAGVQTLQADLRIRIPIVQSATFGYFGMCDGHKKGTVKYTLTGPAPSGFKVTAHVVVTPGGSEDKSETVPAGNSEGSFKITLPRCQAHDPGERCPISGSVRVEGPGNSVSIGGNCSHPPD